MIRTTNDKNSRAQHGDVDEVHDVVVVGVGVAGLNVALLLGRARRNVAAIDARGPRNAPAAHMHGFLLTRCQRPLPAAT
ncbi:hypothetical protein [Streptomyces sp. NPDC059460]|uniref:hypothetical protein n=1 Tax=Streptomyces sp. NPDC059460 TaxID=3346840 RepID=UPI0036778BB6